MEGIVTTTSSIRSAQCHPRRENEQRCDVRADLFLTPREAERKVASFRGRDKREAGAIINKNGTFECEDMKSKSPARCTLEERG